MDASLVVVWTSESEFRVTGVIDAVVGGAFCGVILTGSLEQPATAKPANAAKPTADRPSENFI